MRITKALQEQIFANLLSQHDLQARAIAATQDRQHNLIKLAAQARSRRASAPRETKRRSAPIIARCVTRCRRAHSLA